MSEPTPPEAALEATELEDQKLILCIDDDKRIRDELAMIQRIFEEEFGNAIRLVIVSSAEDGLEELDGDTDYSGVFTDYACARGSRSNPNGVDIAIKATGEKDIPIAMIYSSSSDFIIRGEISRKDREDLLDAGKIEFIRKGRLEELETHVRRLVQRVLGIEDETENAEESST